MRVGETVGNILKVDGTEKRGGKQRFKKVRQAGARGGCLKKGGRNPLTHYDIYLFIIFTLF